MLIYVRQLSRSACMASLGSMSLSQCLHSARAWVSCTTFAHFIVTNFLMLWQIESFLQFLFSNEFESNWFYRSWNLINYLLFSDLIYLLLERREEREKETSLAYLSQAPNLRPSLQPRHVTWLGIEPVTLLYGRTLNWAMPVRAYFLIGPSVFGVF